MSASETTPLLMQIHDEFDVYDRYPYTDHSVISNIKIAVNPDGYCVTTYPGGTGYGYDGLALNVKTDGSMFSVDSPTKVETSRDYGSAMILMVSNIEQGEDTMQIAEGSVGAPMRREGLFLPGDPGFHLFENMHSEIMKLKNPLSEILEAAGVELDLTALNFKESTGTTTYDHDQRITKYSRTTTYDALGENEAVHIELDATTYANFGEEPSPMVTYRAGVIKCERSRQPLSMDTLVAFGGLHRAIGKLYT